MSPSLKSSRKAFKNQPPIKISILEKNENEVSYGWKICQLFSYSIVIISGIASAISMGTIERIFDSNCILYANLTVTNISEDKEITILLSIVNNIWGSKSTCDFCIFSPVCSVIFGGVFGTFFIMCGRGGNSSRNLTQPWRIVPPAILFNLIFTILAAVTLGLTFGGFNTFCGNIKPPLNITNCAQLLDYKWKEFKKADKFYQEVIASEISATFCFVGWLLSFLILLLRCITHADFIILAATSNQSSYEVQTDIENEAESGSPTSRNSQNTIFTSLNSNPPSQLTTPVKRIPVKVDVEPLIND